MFVCQKINEEATDWEVFRSSRGALVDQKIGFRKHLPLGYSVQRDGERVEVSIRPHQGR